MSTVSIGGSAASAPRILVRVERATMNLAGSLKQFGRALRRRRQAEPNHLMQRILPELRLRRPATIAGR